MKYSFILIIIIYFIIYINPTKANFFEDILNEQYIDSINDLPLSEGTPNINWQTNGNIQSFIDIVGFRNLSYESGQYFINDAPEKLAIIQYEANGNPPGKIDSITKSVSFSSFGNDLIASLIVTMKWHKTCWDEYGEFICGRFTETATFQDTEPSPNTYPSLPEDLRVNLTQYNNSLYENIGISIINISGLNKYTIQYEDNIATYRLKKAHVEQTEKGIYFANVTPAEFVELNGKNISRYGKMVLLNGNLTKMSPGDIKITGSNLYETKTANSSQFNIKRLEFKPEKELENPVSMWFMSVMAVMLGGIYFYARRMTEQWLGNM